MEVEINGARIIATFENVPLFGTVQITQTLIVSWLILILISALFIWLGSGLKVTGISRKQAVAETIYTSLVKFRIATTEPHAAPSRMRRMSNLPMPN